MFLLQWATRMYLLGFLDSASAWMKRSQQLHHAAISMSSVLQRKSIPQNQQNDSTFPEPLRYRFVQFAGPVSFVNPCACGLKATPASGVCSYSCCQRLSVSMDAHLGALDRKLEVNWDLIGAAKNRPWHLQSLVVRGVTYWEGYKL